MTLFMWMVAAGLLVAVLIRLGEVFVERGGR